MVIQNIHFIDLNLLTLTGFFVYNDLMNIILLDKKNIFYSNCKL